jgi:hypothetical protein
MKEKLQSDEDHQRCCSLLDTLKAATRTDEEIKKRTNNSKSHLPLPILCLPIPTLPIKTHAPPFRLVLNIAEPTTPTARVGRDGLAEVLEGRAESGQELGFVKDVPGLAPGRPVVVLTGLGFPVRSITSKMAHDGGGETVRWR